MDELDPYRSVERRAAGGAIDLFREHLVDDPDQFEVNCRRVGAVDCRLSGRRAGPAPPSYRRF
jgi:hypothetical protein